MFGSGMRVFAIALLLAGLPARATFHLWQISEIYSNADGSVQFVEFSTPFGGQQFLSGHTLTATQGAATHTFNFAADLPSDTTNKHFLVGTAGFAALGVVTPDYIVPNNFLFIPGGSVDFAGVDVVSYAALPGDGTQSINHAGVAATNSPANFAGATGTIVPPPVATAPGMPTIGSAVAGSTQATIFFTPPASDGGSAITGYTVTCNPGSVIATGPVSPIVVTGLTNGVPYSCSVTATNAIGTGLPSAAVPVMPAAVVTSASGPSATGTGTIVASFTGGGASCGFTSSQFIALQGNAASPPAGSAPAGISFPQGLFTFTTAGCTAASTITMTVTYPAPLPPGTQYWKYGPTAAQPAAHWYTLPATVSSNTITFTITDGGLGDDDLAANGTIVDQGGPGSPGTGSAIPTLDEWALVGMGLLLLVSGFVAMRRMREAPVRPR